MTSVPLYSQPRSWHFFRNDQIVMSATSPGGDSLVPDTDYLSASMATTIAGQSGLGAFDSQFLTQSYDRINILSVPGPKFIGRIPKSSRLFDPFQSQFST